MGGSPGDVGEVPVTYVKQRKGYKMSCDVGEANEVLKNEVWRRWTDIRVVEWGSASNPYIASPTSQIIFQHFRRFTYVTAHSTTFA